MIDPWNYEMPTSSTLRGFAHQLNHVLFAMRGHAVLALEQLKEDDETRDHVVEILAAVRKASRLLSELEGDCRTPSPEARPHERAWEPHAQRGD